MGEYLRRLEQRYMGKQMKIEEMNQTQPPWLVNNILFCYEGEKHTGNESKKKDHLLQNKRNMVVARKLTRLDQRAQEGKTMLLYS